MYRLKNDNHVSVMTGDRVESLLVSAKLNVY